MKHSMTKMAYECLHPAFGSIRLDDENLAIMNYLLNEFEKIKSDTGCPAEMKGMKLNYDQNC